MKHIKQNEQYNGLVEAIYTMHSMYNSNNANPEDKLLESIYQSVDQTHRIDPEKLSDAHLNVINDALEIVFHSALLRKKDPELAEAALKNFEAAIGLHASRALLANPTVDSSSINIAGKTGPERNNQLSA